MILLVNVRVVSVQSYVPPFIPILSGMYDDFSVQWYRAVGSTISLTMIINIFTPHAGALIGYLVKGMQRAWDQRWCKCSRRTTHKSIEDEYKELYTGPEFLIEIRYS